MKFDYTDWLELLIKIGPKLPEAWEKIQAIITNARELLAMFSTGQAPPVAFAMPLQSYEIELESKVLASFSGVPAGAYGAPDFPRLREVFQFLREHPELLKLLLTLLAL